LNTSDDYIRRGGVLLVHPDSFSLRETYIAVTVAHPLV